MNQRLLYMLIFFTGQICFCHGNRGTASRYSPPYTPTACYGSDSNQFPDNMMFAAAGDSIWDNGTACGRKYLVKCLSSRPGVCTPEATVVVKIVDRARTSVTRPARAGATIVLSDAAFRKISRSPYQFVDAEIQS